MTTNPFKDFRVRQAISKALDREALIKAYLGASSAGQAAGQLVNSTINSASPAIKPDKLDIAVARRLLKEAGYPDGFQVTLRDKDARRRVLELIATMLNKVNIQAEVKTLPASKFFPRANRHEFSITHSGYSTDGNLANMLKHLLYTGAHVNSGRYSNTELDEQIDKAQAQTSISRKRRELRKAQEMVIRDLPIIPVMFIAKHWAVRRDMIFLPTDQHYTEAYYVQPNE